MPGGYRARSGGDELGFLLDSGWFCICGTGTFALLPVSWETDIPMKLTCTMNRWSVSLGRTGAQGAPQLWHRCAAAPQATAASQKWVLEHFSDSPFKRQNLRLGSLGTELNNTKKIVV